MRLDKVESVLSQVYKIQRELETLLDEANMMYKLAVDCDGAGAKSAAATVRRYADKINGKVSEYLRLLQKVKTAIDEIDDSDCRVLLTKYYLQHKTWEEIADEMNYSTAHIYRLRKKALSLLKS